MDNYKAEKIFKEAIEVYGKERQIQKFQEEIGEVLQANSKYSLDPTEEKLDHLCEELADLKITTSQMELITDPEKVAYWFDFKMNRLENRIEAEKAKQLEYEETLSRLNPEYFEIFKMVNEIGPNPLDSQMDDLINLVIKQKDIKQEIEFNKFFK